MAISKSIAKQMKVIDILKSPQKVRDLVDAMIVHEDPEDPNKTYIDLGIWRLVIEDGQYVNWYATIS